MRAALSARPGEESQAWGRSQGLGPGQVLLQDLEQSLLLFWGLVLCQDLGRGLV